MPSGLNLPGGRQLRLCLGWLLAGTILWLSFRVSQVNLRTLAAGLMNSLALLRELVPPDFSHWRRILILSGETLAIGFWGTFLGVLISLPLGFLAAQNTAGYVGLYLVSRGVVNLLRAIPDLVFALIFVISLGMGPLAGIAALTLATVGLLGKFYAEAIESIDHRPVEALQGVGGHGLSVIRFAILPQVSPLFLGYNLYLLDHNIRVAMVLGLVGAGGLGVELFTQMRVFQYQKAAAVLIIILILITLIDRLSVYLRLGIIAGTFLQGHRRRRDLCLLVGLILSALLSLFLLPFNLREVLAGLPRLGEFLGGMWPPDFSAWQTYLRLLLETIGMGITGTFLAVILAVPLGLGAARNLVRNSLIYNLAKEVTNLLRAVPELMFALVFVVAVGLGPFAGVLALACHTAGFLGKFYAEAIENIAPGPVEAVTATGARALQRWRYAVWPQITPLFHSYNLYILDRNIRASTLMGIVGAGGIGFELVMSMKLFEYRQTAALVLLILGTILVFDWLSARLRARVV